jgi:hypothetical protein
LDQVDPSLGGIASPVRMTVDVYTVAVADECCIRDLAAEPLAVVTLEGGRLM